MTDTLWVVKISTNWDKRILVPYEILNYEYTVCNESESMYGGDYPKSSNIIGYQTIDNKSIDIPYYNNSADYRYGFYEFISKDELKIWLKNNKPKKFLKLVPEWFI